MGDTAIEPRLINHQFFGAQKAQKGTPTKPSTIACGLVCVSDEAFLRGRGDHEASRGAARRGRGTIIASVSSVGTAFEPGSDGVGS